MIESEKNQPSNIADSTKVQIDSNDYQGKFTEQMTHNTESKPKKSIDLQKIEINPTEKTIYLKKDNDLANIQSQKSAYEKPSINNLINSGTEIVNSTPMNTMNKILVQNAKMSTNNEYQMPQSKNQSTRKALSTSSAFSD